MNDTTRQIADELFAADAPHGVSLALLVMHGGEVVLERYGVQPDSVFGRGGPVTTETTLVSWSMAKSITHAAVGILVGDGLLELDRPAAVAAWQGTAQGGDHAAGSPRYASGAGVGRGLRRRHRESLPRDAVRRRPGRHGRVRGGSADGDQPGSVWNYSSGTTNIICRIIGDIVGGGRDGMETFLRERLFGPVGMNSAVPKFDTSGTFVGSSYVYATARDFAKFGELYRNDGVVDGRRRVLPQGWRDHARTFVASDEDGMAYGSHWWLWRDQPGSLACHGYEGQYCIVVPDKELVVVHLGKCPADSRSELTSRLRKILNSVET